MDAGLAPERALAPGAAWPGTRTRTRVRAASRVRVAAVLALWAGLVFGCARWGNALAARHVRIALGTPPLIGAPGPGLHVGLLVPALAAAALIAVMPYAARRLPWGWLLLVTMAGAALWAIALAVADGPHGLTRGVAQHTDYLADIRYVRARPADFLRHFTTELPRYRVQVRGHPPGMMLLLLAMDALGFRGAVWEAGLVIGTGATAAAGVLVALREVAGDAVARRAVPWLVVAPYAIWVASTADALYMALAAWCVALMVLATGRRGPASMLLAAAGGLVGGCCLMGSYGALLAVVPPLVVALRRRRADVLLVAAAFAAAVLLAFVPFGFWWPDGLRATLREYHGTPMRPYSYFLFGNLAAWAVALGPAIAVALVKLRDRGAWLLVGGALAAALFADLSGLSSGEVERIWLPFTVWVLAAGAAFALTERSTRAWLALQAVGAIAVIALVTTLW